MPPSLSLPVLWSRDGASARPGRLDVCSSSLTLAGGSRLEPERHEVPFAAIGGVRLGRRGDERVAGRAALHLALVDGGSIWIASLSGTGTLVELAERLLALVGPAPEPA